MRILTTKRSTMKHTVIMMMMMHYDQEKKDKIDQINGNSASLIEKRDDVDSPRLFILQKTTIKRMSYAPSNTANLADIILRQNINNQI